MRFKIAAVFTAVGLAVCGVTPPAFAQLMLHNDADSPPPAAGGAHPADPGGGPPPKAKPVPMKAPSEDTLTGKDLLLNGARGVMAFARQGKDLTLTKLSLEGEQLSKPGETCRADITSGLPLTLVPQGRPEGMLRYKAALPSCTFSFDVLEGAVLVQSGETCEIKAADCKSDPAGLWGMQGNTIAPAKAREMEHARVRIETDMRANFRVLLSRAGKDKVQIKKVAGEQAGFSSQREMLCHSYALESQHGFCALEITRARVLTLLAKLNEVPEEDAKPVKPAKKRPKPMAPAPAATAPGPSFQGAGSPSSDRFH